MLRDALWCPAQGVAEARERTSAWLSEASAIGGGRRVCKSRQVKSNHNRILRITHASSLYGRETVVYLLPHGFRPNLPFLVTATARAL